MSKTNKSLKAQVAKAKGGKEYNPQSAKRGTQRRYFSNSPYLLPVLTKSSYFLTGLVVVIEFNQSLHGVYLCVFAKAAG